jgi:hypothetical protein
MNWRLTLILLALLSSCQQSTSREEEPRITDPKKLAYLREMLVPKAYVRTEDQRRAERLREGYSGPFPCTHEQDGGHIVALVPEYECYKMTEPRRMHGLWRNDFEGQAFCAAPAEECPPPGRWQPNHPGVAWIDFGSPLPGSDYTLPGGLYAIEFVGRATAYPGHYGGYGFYNQEVVVDRLVSIKMIEPPPAQPTKADLIRSLKECEKAKTCIPDWNWINETDDAQLKKARVQAYLKDCAGKPICMPNSEVPNFNQGAP